MHATALVRSLRSAVLGTVIALGATIVSAHAVAAQTISAMYAPFSGPGTSSGLVRFTVANGTSTTLTFDALTLNATSPFSFAASSTYEAEDTVGPFGGFVNVLGGGSQARLDFLGDNGFAFELASGRSGTIDLALARAAGTPTLTPTAFTFSTQLTGRPTPVTGAVTVAATSTVPEPSTYVLVASGLGAVGMVARRRRTRA